MPRRRATEVSADKALATRLGKCMQFITGHACMIPQQNLVDSAAGDDDRQVTSPTCRLCGHKDETPLHLVTECDETIWDAQNILGGQGIHPDPYDPRIVFKWGIQKIRPILRPARTPVPAGGQDLNRT